MIQNIWLQRFEVDKSSDEIEKRREEKKIKFRFRRLPKWISKEIRRLKFRKIIEENENKWSRSGSDGALAPCNVAGMRPKWSVSG